MRVNLIRRDVHRLRRRQRRHAIIAGTRSSASWSGAIQIPGASNSSTSQCGYLLYKRNWNFGIRGELQAGEMTSAYLHEDEVRFDSNKARILDNVGEKVDDCVDGTEKAKSVLAVSQK
jgi:hypothetical protein